MVKLQDAYDIFQLTDDADNTITCSSDQFCQIEPSYHAPLPGQVRIWKSAVHCLIVDGDQQADPFYTEERFWLYLSKISIYQALLAADVPEISFAEVKAQSLAAWNQQVNAFINRYYDTGTQISFLKIYIQNEAARPLITQVDAWVTAVMSYYYQLKSSIQVASTKLELTELQPGMEFDSRFGPQGTLAPVPDVQLVQFFYDNV